MKKILLFAPAFALLFLACKPKTEDPRPNTYPFGYSLNNFQLLDAVKYEGGDCWGSLLEYAKDEWKIVTDSSQCSEYNASAAYLLMKNDSIQVAHNIIFESGYNEQAQKSFQIATEMIYDFTADPPVLFSRTDTVETRDITLLKTTYKKENMQNVEAKYVEFANRIAMAKAEKMGNKSRESGHFICYTGDENLSMEIMIAFINEKAMSVKYKGQTESISLEFEKEEYQEGGAHPTIIEYYKEMVNGKENGKYKLTHSGIWDYAEYIRGSDGKVFKFTINHDISIGEYGYAEEPCF